MKLKDGTKWKHVKTNDVYTLSEDYNGSWYLHRRLDGGVAKTVSINDYEMLEVLGEFYVKYEEKSDKVFMKELPITKKANKKYKKIITREQYSITAAISHEELGWFVDKIKALETELAKIKKEMA
ncbi:hypothetical protein Spock_186 [Bacillus phage Spock]|uniref:Uncharacterized protein n=1 Tax=Bacillus phage Spock TaxID=1406791 RepID=U5PXU8_9CAUD|nr:hypothetical protein Spock_186 [Bacillus phage Spock]AGY48586.1 hypothetical protein Spock_186 [Bacillus phage Spock]